MNMFSLAGKSAIVTGGNGGIGLGMARGLAKAGANIAIVARNQEKSRAAAQELETLGAEVICIACDVTQSAQIGAMVEQTAEAFGGVDILVNNAGTNIRKRPELLAEEEWHTVLDTNVSSAFLCSKACYAHMKQRGGGKILNNGSMLSLFGSAWGTAYSVSKGGIVQMTKSLATAWAQDNIQVNCFLPGWIDTELTQRARSEVERLNEDVLARTPAGRWGHIDDFQGIAAFLASSGSDFITGATIAVDGGFSIKI